MSATPIEHPAARAAHALRNALQILNGMTATDRENAQSLRMDASDVRRLIEPVLEDVGALQQYIDRQEENIATMTQESLETHRLLTDANHRASLAQQELEHLYVGASMDLERHTTRFNTVVRLRTLLDVPATPTHTDSPRAAAAGR